MRILKIQEWLKVVFNFAPGKYFLGIRVVYTCTYSHILLYILRIDQSFNIKCARYQAQLLYSSGSGAILKVPSLQFMSVIK